MNKAPYGRTLRTSALSSGTGSLRACSVRAPFDHLPLIVDHPIGRMPDAPHLHLTLTVGTPEGIAPRALLVPLSVGQPGDDLHRALDHALDLGQGRANDHLDLGKRLGGLHPVIPNTLEPFGHGVLHHAANKREDIHRFLFHPVGPVGAVMVRDPLAIIALNAPDGDRWTHHIAGHVTRHTLRL